jgi:predicted lipoprotein with Yx(FWY)xxD motif
LILWCAGAVAVVLLVLSSVGLFSSKPTPKETVVSSIATSHYGRVLVVGGSANGGLYHFPLYEFSGDVNGQLGCGTTRTVAYDLGAKESVPLTCTGPERDLLADVSSDDWPALTTANTPIAGPGVDAKLLGTVYRRGIGRQITYAGHPLYLFDPSSQPFAPQGENFMETVKPLPPWHGYWYVVSATTGAPSPGVARIESETLPSGRRALAVEEDGNVDPIEVTLYAAEVSDGGGQCAANCTEGWTPLLTSAPPQLSADMSGTEIGITKVSSGNYQVTYEHRPLYLYDREEIRLNANDHLVTGGSMGNGDGVRGPGGTMAAITLHK